jgi:hypothetical protein
MARVPVAPLTELFRARVLAMLKREGLIDDILIANIMKWRHTSGFSVHNSVRISARDETGITNLAQYIMRSPFSTAKLNYNSSTGMVIYRSGKRRLRRCLMAGIRKISQSPLLRSSLQP